MKRAKPQVPMPPPLLKISGEVRGALGRKLQPDFDSPVRAAVLEHIQKWMVCLRTEDLLAMLPVIVRHAERDAQP